MAHPFLKSIKPVNLLSFGPNTEEIELRPLNILIGPNGSGKSNLIEIIRLLSCLPDKDPWKTILRTGGVDEWTWKGGVEPTSQSSILARITLEAMPVSNGLVDIRAYEYSIGLTKLNSSFYVRNESVRPANVSSTDANLVTSFESGGNAGILKTRQSLTNFSSDVNIQLNPERSVLSQRSSRSLQEALIGKHIPALFEIAEFLENFEFHQDWEFGADLTARNPVGVGQGIDRLSKSASNLAQMLAYFRDFHRPTFERINEFMKKFYEPSGSVEIRVIGTHLQIAIDEDDGFSTSAYRLSDGTLRWLALLTILLNPNPAPVICIDEPELGLHPDMLPTLADLLVDASERTQLIVTTHSTGLVDAFSDDPEAICVCEKVDGATQIRRLNADGLRSWLEDYSLGTLWAKGEIGGNRW